MLLPGPLDVWQWWSGVSYVPSLLPSLEGLVPGGAQTGLLLVPLGEVVAVVVIVWFAGPRCRVLAVAGARSHILLVVACTPCGCS